MRNISLKVQRLSGRVLQPQGFAGHKFSDSTLKYDGIVRIQIFEYMFKDKYFSLHFSVNLPNETEFSNFFNHLNVHLCKRVHISHLIVTLYFLYRSYLGALHYTFYTLFKHLLALIIIFVFSCLSVQVNLCMI